MEHSPSSEAKRFSASQEIPLHFMEPEVSLPISCPPPVPILSQLDYPFHFFCCGAATQRGSWPPHSWGFIDHTQRRTTVGRTHLDEWSARCRDFYLTTHKTHNRQTFMPPVGFEPTISKGERPQTYALDRAATGTGIYIYIYIYICVCVCVYVLTFTNRTIHNLTR